jgi:two-component system sensor histidine kinase MprB
MSLRWRLALALALLAGLATTATALVAYASTSDRLHAEADRFLRERVAAFGSGDHGVGGPPGGPPGGRRGGLVQYDTEVQVLSADGAVLGRSGDVTLPVSDEDRAIADGRAGGRFASVLVGDVPYRVLTFPLRDGGAAQVARDLTETTRVLHLLRVRFLTVGLGVIAAAVAAGALIARRETAPLEQLARTAEHVASTGDLSAPITTAGTGETARLASAFGTMLDALARSRAQQQQLVQDAGHELRTPLTSVRTNVDVLAKHADLPAHERDALLADLRSEAAELSALIDELVLLATDQRDDEPVSAVALRPLADRVAARAARRHERRFRVQGEGAVVEGRPGALERALANLADNAAKFSPPDTTIEIALDGGRVSVRDHGPGIDAADLPRVFDRFYRSAAARPLPGSGLGLAIVRQVAESTGGTVFARNHPDGGAEVGMQLPVSGEAGS